MVKRTFSSKYISIWAPISLLLSLKCNLINLPNLLELSFNNVLALPNASKIGLHDEIAFLIFSFFILSILSVIFGFLLNEDLSSGGAVYDFNIAIKNYNILNNNIKNAINEYKSLKLISNNWKDKLENSLNSLYQYQNKIDIFTNKIIKFN